MFDTTDRDGLVQMIADLENPEFCNGLNPRLPEDDDEFELKPPNVHLDGDVLYHVKPMDDEHADKLWMQALAPKHRWAASFV